MEIVKANSKKTSEKVMAKVNIHNVLGEPTVAEVYGEYYETVEKDDVLLFQYYDRVGIADLDGEVVAMFDEYDDAREFVRKM